MRRGGRCVGGIRGVADRLRDLARRAVGARHLGSGAGLRDTTDVCRKLLAELRKRCPDLIPPAPLKPGTVGPRIPVDVRTAAELVRASVRPERGEAILWEEGENALLVHTGKIDLDFRDGQVIVAIPVRCDQVRSAVVRVPFAMGSAERPAGLVAATHARPDGPPEVVEIWGEALTALAWQALLGVASVLAGESGEDLDGTGLIPVALAATPDGFTVLTMARHPFDRVGPATVQGKRP
jgi:hypothetical protein